MTRSFILGRGCRVTTKGILSGFLLTVLLTLMLLAPISNGNLYQSNTLGDKAYASLPDTLASEEISDGSVAPILNSTSVEIPPTEALVPVEGDISKSFSSPIMHFDGADDSRLSQTITWYHNGTVALSDSLRRAFVLNLPLSEASLSISQNSTMVDQVIVDNDTQYHVFWQHVSDKVANTEHYKFSIVGTSKTNHEIKLHVQERPGTTLILQGNRLLSIRDQDLLLNSTSVGGLGIDWSDAIESGNKVSYEPTNHTIIFEVSNSFSIDPVTVDTVGSSVTNSPVLTDYYEGERRVVSIGSTLYSFYYNGTTILYKYSVDGGSTWSAKLNTGTSPLNSDISRWTIARTQISGTNYIILFSFDATGSNTLFHTYRGTVDTVSHNISWTGVFNGLPSPANNAGCGGGVCTAVAAATSTNSTIFAAFRWVPSGASNYQYQIIKSADGGASWSTSLPLNTTSSSNKIEIALTNLGSGPSDMLFLYAQYGSREFTYRTYLNGTWSQEKTTSCSCMAINTLKQISLTTDSDSHPTVAFLSTTPPGPVNVAQFYSNGTFISNSRQSLNSTLLSSLPSIVKSGEGALRIYALSGSKVYEFVKPPGPGSTWTENAVNPFGTTFNSPNQLTAPINFAGALWVETSGSNLNIRFAADQPTYVPPTVQVSSSYSTAISPASSDYYEGEHRIVNIGGALFAFYYDGSNIVYKTSTNIGGTWSATATSAATGQIAPDNYRWTVATGTSSSGNNTITLLYYNITGSNTWFLAKTGQVSGTSVTWNKASLLFSKPGTNLAAAAVGTIGSSGNVLAAFRYLSSGTYRYQIWNGTNGGNSWSSTLSEVNTGNTTRIEMAIAGQTDGFVLFAYATYGSGGIAWNDYSPYTHSWRTNNAAISTSMPVNTVKQISAASDYAGFAGVAFVSGGTSGTPYVAWWSTGSSTTRSFDVGVERVDPSSSVSHSLPSIVTDPGGRAHLFTLVNGKVLETTRPLLLGVSPTSCAGCWSLPATPFSGSFSNPDQLTAGISYTGALWVEGSPSNKIMGGIVPLSQPYIFAYNIEPYEEAKMVFGENNFVGTTATSLHYDLLSTISVAGWDTNEGNVTNYIYQGIVRMAPDNTVRADPQVFFGENVVWGCFLTNTCPILTTGTSFSSAYQEISWNNSTDVATFYVEATTTGGGLSAVDLDYFPDQINDKSNAFVAGIVSHGTIDGTLVKDYLGKTVDFKTSQFGIESDGENPNWAASQTFMGYVNLDGQENLLEDLNVKEGTQNKDPTNGSEITYSVGTNGLVTLFIPGEIAFNPYYAKADYFNVDPSVDPGTINWSSGPPTVKPGSVLWTNP